MSRKYLHPLAVFAAAGLAAFGGPVTHAAPGEVAAGGMRLVATVDANSFVPAGEIGMGVPFVHSIKVSGDFSVNLEGVSAVRGGEIVVGYLIGCAVDIANGISIGIAPSIGVNAGIAPSVNLESGVDVTLAIDAPPSITIGGGIGVGVQPSVGVEAGLAGELAVNLAPGTVTAAAIGAAELGPEAEFPYTFAHANTPLTVNGCLSPASAMPFVTVRADSRNSTAQTTGYGNAFGF
ncbi:MspA family porin [Nocardia takedensis]|uniref:MspA family porin n=1 Tax=Nocardia takedensis TaxID=259390 RepID=UPI000592F269|nr:MspA family porin [Nocardia takedensis]